MYSSDPDEWLRSGFSEFSGRTDPERASLAQWLEVRGSGWPHSSLKFVLITCMFLVDLLTTGIDSIQESPSFIQSCANEVVTSGEVCTEAKQQR